jgi:hypothetical protein
MKWCSIRCYIADVETARTCAADGREKVVPPAYRTLCPDHVNKATGGGRSWAAKLERLYAQHETDATGEEVRDRPALPEVEDHDSDALAQTDEDCEDSGGIDYAQSDEDSEDPGLDDYEMSDEEAEEQGLEDYDESEEDLEVQSWEDHTDSNEEIEDEGWRASTESDEEMGG